MGKGSAKTGRKKGPPTRVQRLLSQHSDQLRFIAKRCGCRARDVFAFLSGAALADLHARVRAGERVEIGGKKGAA